MATARSPSRRAAARSRASAASSSGSSTAPSAASALVGLDRARVQHAAAGGSRARRCRAGAGGRCAARRASRASRPAASARRLRSSSALVATVVPRRTDSMRAPAGAWRAQQFADAAHGRVARAAPGRATAPCARAARRPGRVATMSVKVPPRSMAKRQPPRGRRGRSRLACDDRCPVARSRRRARNENCCRDSGTAAGAMIAAYHRGARMTERFVVFSHGTGQRAVGQQDRRHGGDRARGGLPRRVGGLPRHRRSAARASRGCSPSARTCAARWCWSGSSMGGYVSVAGSSLLQARGMFLLAPGAVHAGLREVQPAAGHVPDHDHPRLARRGDPRRQQHPLRARAEGHAARRGLRPPPARPDPRDQPLLLVLPVHDRRVHCRPEQRRGTLAIFSVDGSAIG